MSVDERFVAAQTQVKTLTKRPSNDELLSLYSLFKQATDGDVSGKRPGMLDIRGRAKFDAWKKRKGTTADSAKTQYIALVERLLG